MEIGLIIAAYLRTPSFRNRIDCDDPAGEAVAVGGMIHRSAGDGDCLVDGEIMSILRVQHTIGVDRPTPDAKHVVRYPVALIVDVVEVERRGSVRLVGLVISSNHRAHRHSVVAIMEHDVGQNLRRRLDGDFVALSELPETALLAEDAEPKLTIRGAAGHGAEHVLVDVKQFHDGLGGDVLSRRGAGVDGEDDAVTHNHPKGCCAFLVIELDWTGVLGRRTDDAVGNRGRQPLGTGFDERFGATGFLSRAICTLGFFR